MCVALSACAWPFPFGGFPLLLITRDVLSNDEVADCVKSSMDAQTAADALVDLAYNRDSMDNLTALVVDLRSFRDHAGE